MARASLNPHSRSSLAQDGYLDLLTDSIYRNGGPSASYTLTKVDYSGFLASITTFTQLHWFDYDGDDDLDVFVLTRNEDVDEPCLLYTSPSPRDS